MCTVLLITVECNNTQLTIKSQTVVPLIILEKPIYINGCKSVVHPCSLIIIMQSCEGSSLLKCAKSENVTEQNRSALL